MTRPPSKDEILEEIASLSGLPFRKTVLGGTVLKPFFDDMAEVFQVSNAGTKPDVLRRCVESVGHKWLPEYDSTGTRSKGGGTITTAGLLAVQNALVDKLAMEHEEIEPGVIKMPQNDYQIASEIYLHEGDFQPGQIDPDLLGDGYERHNKTQNLLAQALRDLGIEVFSPNSDQPRFDIMWKSNEKTIVGEVKSVTNSNLESQLRTALGQVLRYRTQLDLLGIKAYAVVIVDHEIGDLTWWKVFEASGVGLLEAPGFAGLYKFC